MTDSSLPVQGDFAPAELSISESLALAAQPVAAASNGFVRLGLAPELVQAVEDLGFTQPTSVQDKVIPMAMASEPGEGERFVDLMVSSQTGSGKTAAFLLPVLHTLIRRQADEEAAARAEFERSCADAAAKGEPAPKRAKRKDPTNPRHFKAAAPGALVLCPTRELAQQVAHDAIDLVKHCRGLRIANVVGGMPYQLQIARLQNADLVVATPGRLLDLQRSMQIQLDQVKFLVVDEADRMLDLGFSDDLAELNQLTAGRQQTMMFSATFAPRIQQLATRVMRQPQKVQIDSPQEKHANIKQVLFWADSAMHKRKLLDHWLRDTTINQAIVFASTQVECDGLANDLQQTGFSAVALHGALSQGLRNRRLMALRNGQVQILVATDVAARGIDVPTITHVFNFGLPMKAEDYTHRIGRTGRAGRDGLAVTFAEFRDRRKIFDIEGYSKQSFKAEVIPGLEPQQRFTESRAPQGRHGAGARGSRDGRDARPAGGRGGEYRGRRDGDGGYGHKPGFGESAFAPRGGYGAARSEGGSDNRGGHAAPRGSHGFAPKPAGARASAKPFAPYEGRNKRAAKPVR
ncbi:DEAD/DEAH box helicase [Ramlibacter sp. H39-3-26]|uniref:DEAD/DEAH box helicase n=1 Tax=Curvibacter soli TaxID=3031331 RepID=UPI0023DCEB7E|nr:DEAD/DEAH box helicase [Ramlibacter sp. H39-3-26]MDF1483881.1 DEAD/DEAH box helicase [Ramlibacter sp. H39-3-26]